MIGLLIGINFKTITLVSGVSGVVLGLVSSLICLRIALRKEYRDFHIAIVADKPSLGSFVER